MRHSHVRHYLAKLGGRRQRSKICPVCRRSIGQRRVTVNGVAYHRRCAPVRPDL